MLKKIKEANIKTAIITDNKLNIQLQKLRALKIDKYIDHIVTSEEAGADKPAVNQFLLAMHKLQSTIYNTLVIGNNPETDIKGAINSNLQSCFFDPNKKYSTTNSTYYITNFKELENILMLNTIKYSHKKLLVLDFIGVLMFPAHIICTLLYPLLKKHNYKRSYKVVKQFYIQLSKGFITPKEFWNNLNITKYDNIEKEFLNNWTINTQLLPIIRQFKKSPNWKIALFSNIPKAWGEYQVGRYKLDKLFDKILFSGEYKVRKPNPAFYQAIVDNFQDINPTNIYYVDDKLEALKLAQHYLIKTIWIKREEQPIVHIPDYYTNKQTSLTQILQSIL